MANTQAQQVQDHAEHHPDPTNPTNTTDATPHQVPHEHHKEAHQHHHGVGSWLKANFVRAPGVDNYNNSSISLEPSHPRFHPQAKYSYPPKAGSKSAQ